MKNCGYELRELSKEFQNKLRNDLEEILNTGNPGIKFKINKDKEFSSSNCYIESKCPFQISLNSRIYCTKQSK